MSMSMSMPAEPRVCSFGAWRAAAPRLYCHDAHSSGRPAVEAFIGDVFRRRYGAEVRQFAPMLVSLHDAHGERVAAAGFRSAAAAPLFLERYLDGPVQTLLPAAPPRARIVEVGHLAANRAGEGRRLIRLLGAWLADAGFDWVVCTMTQELRHLFARMGVAPLALGVADPAALGEQAQQWGRYYDHRPQVLAGRLASAVPALGGGHA
jgi:hypothetical protein